MGTKLKVMTPAWHSEAARILRDNFSVIHAQFLDATNRAVWLGLFLNFVKERGKSDRSIPHGEFGPWLERNVPEVSWDTANRYMKIARGVAEQGKFEIVQFAELAQEANLSFLQLLNADHLPPQLAAIKERVDSMIAGKTSTQLLLEFKQVDAEGNPRRGRLKGSAGNPLHQRLAARERLAAAQLELLRDRVDHLRREMLELADARHLGELELGEQLFNDTFEAAQTLLNFMKQVKAYRKGVS